MKVGIITCMTCMFAVALTLRGPIRRQSSQSEKTVPIGGNVTLMCPLVHNVIWVYWKKNNHTIYSLEVQSNTQCTDGTLGTRYEGSSNATHLMIKDLKKTDGGIYHCKVATSDTTPDNIKEGGRVLLSVADQEGGLFTTSPGFPVRASTPMPPKPPKPPNTFYLAFSITLSILIIIIIIIIIVTMCLVFKNRKQKAKSRLVKAKQIGLLDDKDSEIRKLQSDVKHKDQEIAELKSQSDRESIYLSAKSSIQPLSNDNSDTTEGQNEPNAEPQPSKSPLSTDYDPTMEELTTLLHNAPKSNDQGSAKPGLLKDEIKGPMIKKIYGKDEEKAIADPDMQNRDVKELKNTNLKKSTELNKKSTWIPGEKGMD